MKFTHPPMPGGRILAKLKASNNHVDAFTISLI